MFTIFRSVFSLLLSFGLLLVANGLFNSLLGLRANLEGMSTTYIGIIMSCHFVGILLGGLHAGRVIAGVGHIRAFATFASLLSVAALMHAIFIELLPWMALRMVSGFCTAGMLMVTESWLNERSGSQYRGSILATYMMVNYLGLASGQMLLKLGDISEFQLFSLASIIFSLALVPVLLTRHSAPILKRGPRLPIMSVIRLGPLAIAGIFTAGMINASINTLTPIYAMHIYGNTDQVANFTALMLVSGFVLQWPLGRLSDIVGRGVLIAVVAIMIAICSLGMIFSASYVPQWIWVMAFIYGAFLYTLYALCSALINDVIDSDMRVRVAGSILIIYGVGAISGPLLVGALTDIAGPQALFMFSFAISSCLAAFAIYRRIYQAIFVKPVQPFVPVPSQSAPSDELYLATQDNQDTLPGASLEDNEGVLHK
ncbi:MAG: MFS transporter [Gammaproteobacteria bacterium]|jgi:MFS family permease|nr:MFS transporter [Gammaproteobacteria bacterium]